MTNYNYAYIGLLLILVACGKTEKETPNGLKYTVIKNGDGVVPVVDQVLVFDYQLKDSKDSVWGETFKEGIPGAAKIADSTQQKTEDGLTQMFRMLSKGDSVRTEMPVNEFFNKVVGSPPPPYVDTTRSIIYTLKVQDIMSVEEYMKTREAQVKKREDKIFSRDKKDIEQYLTKNNINALQDTSGLQYVIHYSRGGKKPKVEQCVEVKYTGTILETGKVFDKSEKIAFPLNGVISGWRFGIPMLGIGDSATFFIPSKLGYGPPGYAGVIPPDAVLIFKVTLLDIKSEYDQETRTCK